MIERNTFRKTREGLVVGDRMDKTVIVAVEDRSSKSSKRPSKANGSRWKER